MKKSLLLRQFFHTTYDRCSVLRKEKLYISLEVLEFNLVVLKIKLL